MTKLPNQSVFKKKKNYVQYYNSHGTEFLLIFSCLHNKNGISNQLINSNGAVSEKKRFFMWNSLPNSVVRKIGSQKIRREIWISMKVIIIFFTRQL